MSRAHKGRQAGAETEITPAMIAAGVAALFDELPEECVSWRTPGVGSAVCRVFSAMMEARVASDNIVQKEPRSDPEF
jgi:hypothetical protein